MSRAIGKVDPARLRWKVSLDLVRDPVDPARTLERTRVDETDKHRSIALHCVDGIPWEETPLFRMIYRTRLRAGDVVRGCRTMEALAGHYRGRVDPMFRDMQAHGYRQEIDGRETPPIPVYLGHDGEFLVGNQGNHRLAMAQVLGLPFVIVEIMGTHPDYRSPVVPYEAVAVDEGPDLPPSARAIPAMTTDAERRCYYRLTRAQASEGAIVELGAWLGAATAYLAAGVRDAGGARKVQVYDRFVWKASSHDKKAGGPIQTSQLEAFQQGLGDLLAFVDVHAGEVRGLKWDGSPVGLLVCDAPKRIPEIASVLATFKTALQPGALMAWQDFGYFPSYDIPAALMRLSGRLEFVEGVYPGTTAVFRVREPLRGQDVSLEALALKRWTPGEVETAWTTWGAKLPAPMRPRFACGAALFLCDLGAHDRARAWLRAVLTAHPAEVLPKWRYLLEERGALMARYRPLVEEVQRCA